MLKVCSTTVDGMAYTEMLYDDNMSDPSSDRLCWYHLFSDSIYVLVALSLENFICSSSSFNPQPGTINVSSVAGTPLRKDGI